MSENIVNSLQHVKLGIYGGNMKSYMFLYWQQYNYSKFTG